MQAQPSVVEDLRAALHVEPIPQATHDDVPTIWVTSDEASRVLRHLKEGVEKPYRVLYDLTAIDERVRTRAA